MQPSAVVLYEYTDGDISLSTNGMYIYYFVRAYNGSYSGMSNIVLVRGYFYKENISGEDDQKLKFNLSQNYPNPFNPSSVISFRIASKERVLLRVFDVLGREVARLVDDIRDAGPYDVEFNAAELPSGTYFYELQAGNFIDTKKMILLR